MEKRVLLKRVDLSTDPESRLYIKDEIVHVIFAEEDGELISQVGPNRYQRGDALITGSTGDCWCVSRDRFDAKYEAITPFANGTNGDYRNKPLPVWAKQMTEPFAVARSAGGDILHGNTDDWLIQYAPGDYGIVDNARFQRVYQIQDTLK